MARWKKNHSWLQKRLSWLQKLRTGGLFWRKSEDETSRNADIVTEVFSPLTYRNPCITYMRQIVNEILTKRNLSYQKFALAVIDIEGGESTDFLDHAVNRYLEQEFYGDFYSETGLDGYDVKDDADVWNSLYQLTPDLNYLQLLTDRPVYYKKFVHDMYMEYGLLVQRIPKAEARHGQGNFILDFERSMKTYESMITQKDAIYLPVYKKSWEIGENLDITVPVGYNTLIVTGCKMSQNQDETLDDTSLEQEFRRG